MLSTFNLTPHNSHYSGMLNAGELAWLKVCSIDKADNLQTLLGGRAVDSVLEVGCGTGAVLAELARRRIGSKQVGIDVTEPRDHTDPGARDLELLRYDGDRIPFGDSSFDLVYASHVVEHVENPREFLNELSRVAKKFIYIEVPCELHFRTSHKTIQSTVNIGHINAYSPDTFLLTLQTSKLNVLDIRLFDHRMDVYRFQNSRGVAFIKKAIRQGALNANAAIASRLFTYHCGALCEPMRSR